MVQGKGGVKKKKKKSKRRCIFQPAGGDVGPSALESAHTKVRLSVHTQTRRHKGRPQASFPSRVQTSPDRRTDRELGDKALRPLHISTFSSHSVFV